MITFNDIVTTALQFRKDYSNHSSKYRFEADVNQNTVRLIHVPINSNGEAEKPTVAYMFYAFKDTVAYTTSSGV